MGMPVEPPEPVNADKSNITLGDVQAMIEARVKEVESAADRKIKSLEAQYQAQLKAAQGSRPADHYVPQNAGGVGLEIHQVWSQWHQELANRGELTEELIRATKGLVPLAEDLAEAV